jgi:hypothetical protein
MSCRFTVQGSVLPGTQFTCALWAVLGVVIWSLRLNVTSVWPLEESGHPGGLGHLCLQPEIKDELCDPSLSRR